MDLILKRTDLEVDGIFSTLTNNQGDLVAYCLEHSYDAGAGNGSYIPKIPDGTFICKRSMHRLHGMTHDFETFQVMDVPGHTNILFHWGNYNKDSEGCILVGRHVVTILKGERMITHSRDAFVKFMALQQGADSFTLTVR